MKVLDFGRRAAEAVRVSARNAEPAAPVGSDARVVGYSANGDLVFAKTFGGA